jgi:hypothetical protein
LHTAPRDARVAELVISTLGLGILFVVMNNGPIS